MKATTPGYEQKESAISQVADEKPWLFKPGQSGNPSGRPKSKPLTDALAKQLTPEVCEEIAKAMIAKMRKSSVAHFQEVANRIEGKVVDADDSRGNVVFNIKISAPRPYNTLPEPVTDTQDDGDKLHD